MLDFFFLKGAFAHFLQESFHEEYHNPDASLVASLIHNGGCHAKQRLPSPTSQ